MPDVPQTFPEIEAWVNRNSSERERQILRVAPEYEKTVIEMFTAKFYKDVERVLQSRQGHGSKKPGSHSQNKHK